MRMRTKFTGPTMKNRVKWEMNEFVLYHFDVYSQRRMKEKVKSKNKQKYWYLNDINKVKFEKISKEWSWIYVFFAG